VTSQARIIAAVKNIDAPMWMRVWQELSRIDVCRLTRGAHIENLYLSGKPFSLFLWL
jgi:phage FluMu protein gp41